MGKFENDNDNNNPRAERAERAERGGRGGGRGGGMGGGGRGSGGGLRGGPGPRGLGHHRRHLVDDRMGAAGWGGGRRMRRGDIRRVILAALREEPAHGYEVMRRLEDMSGGLWRPSPGSIYPHLALLEHEGLVESYDEDGNRTYKLTDAGKAEAALSEQLPWEEDSLGGDQARDLRQSMGQLMQAAKQLSGVGSTEQIGRGLDIIGKARKEIYRILAED
ncbi:MAG TPA: PadR family transcriptional regulator [Acidimicrobiales bacterium]|jgi:DNA-binding PadR family transcriptional regulator